MCSRWPLLGLLILTVGCEASDPLGVADAAFLDAEVARSDAGARDAAALDATALDATPPDAGVADADAGIARDAGAPADGGEARDPGPPVFPATIGTLTVALRTADLATAGTNANELSLCLTEVDCFPLDVRDVDDFRVGELDVYSFEGLELPRAAVDRVALRSRNGTDRFIPACLELQFDGEPVYCQALTDVWLGDDVNEVEDWSDPAGLHHGCQSCYPTFLTHGPMVGEVGPTHARVWFRTDATRRALVRVSTSADPSSAPVAAYAYPRAEDDYAAEVRVDRLLPDTTYFYSVEVEGQVLATSQFRTAPPLGAPSAFNFAFGSCSRLADQPIFARVQAEAPELFVFVGDNHYGNTADLNSLRWYYRWGLERPERATFLARTPSIAVWDDHDYTGNNTDGAAPGKDTALRVFREYWANPSAGTPTVPGIFFRYDYGDVSFFMLDDRYHRGLDGSLLGAAQTAWLTYELTASTATFKILVSGSQWTSQGSSDSWAAFPAASQALFRFLDDADIEGVVLLSGDVHRSEFRVLPRSSGYPLPELTSSPMANVNSPCQNESELTACEADANFFIDVAVDTTAADPRLTARIIDEAGAVRATWTILRSQLE